MSSPMYYLIRLDPPPRSLGAFNNRIGNYRWDHPKNDSRRRCEISFVQEGTLIEARRDGERVFRQGTVNTLSSGHSVVRYSTDPVLHEFYFVFYPDQLPEVIGEEAVAGWSSTENEAILPDLVTDPTVCQRIARVIKATVGLAERDQVARGLKLRAALHECLYLLTEYAVRQARQRQEHREKQLSEHTQRAADYILEHLAGKLSAAEVAKAIGVSYNTLKAAFRRDMGMTLTEYIRLARIRRVEHLITVEGMTLEEAGVLVGIPNRDYLSCLFHRYTGMTVREYRRVYSERLTRSNPGKGRKPEQT